MIPGLYSIPLWQMSILVLFQLKHPTESYGTRPVHVELLMGQWYRSALDTSVSDEDLRTFLVTHLTESYGARPVHVEILMGLLYRDCIRYLCS